MISMLTVPIIDELSEHLTHTYHIAKKTVNRTSSKIGESVKKPLFFVCNNFHSCKICLVLSNNLMFTVCVVINTITFSCSFR